MYKKCDKCTKIDAEKEIVQFMVELYCHKKHNRLIKTDGLCEQCEELLEYARLKLDKCKYGEQKNSCKKCATHCYKLHMKQQIRTVMRFSAPRMLFYSPLKAIKHLL